MIRLETQRLSGFNNTPIDEPTLFEVVKLDGRALDYESMLNNTPAVTSSYDAVDQPQLVLGAEAGDALHWDETEHYPAGRLSSIHGRNLEILAGTVAVEDQFGNYYQSLSIKGSDFSDPHLIESETASRDFIIYGLQESLVMERVIRASRVLREHGVSTEYICGLVIPESFPITSSGSEADKKLLALPNLVENLATKYAQENGAKDKSALEVKTGMLERFHDVDYLVTYRAMDTPYRFGELAEPDKVKAFCDFLLRNNDDPNLAEYISDFHEIRYIVRDFTDEIATNVAKMHDIGISHGFLHANNITALGSIVDLDSCRGEILGLGDEPITDKDIYEDVLSVLAAIQTVLGKMEPNPNQNMRKFLLMQDIQHLAASYFLAEYAEKRFTDQAAAESFFVGLIVNLADEDADDYAAFMRNCERVVGGYRAYLKDKEEAPHIDDADVPDFAGYDMRLFRRQDSALRVVPARFFKEHRDKLPDLEWTHHAQAYANIHGKEQIPHPQIKAAIRNIGLRLLIEHAEQAGLTRNAQAFLVAVGCGASIGNTDPNKPPATNLGLHHYLVAQTKAIIARLGDETTQKDAPVVESLLHKGLEDLKDQTGVLRYEERRGQASLLYLDGATQYRRVFDALSLEGDTPVTYTKLEGMIGEVIDDDDDTILLVDYKTAETVADRAGSRNDLVLSIFGFDQDCRPLVLVQGLMSGDVKVSIAYYEGIEPQSLPVKLADLSLETLRPKEQSRLFEPVS